MRPRFSYQPKNTLQVTILGSAGLIFLALLYFLMMPPPPTGGPGYIITGKTNNNILNPDGGKIMSSLPTDAEWRQTNDEYPQFEKLTANGGANQPWQPLPNAGTEPTGTATAQDLQSGAGCGTTDITTDQNGGSDYAYYSVVDPDGVADNGDEWLAVAVRVADRAGSSSSFSFLLDTQNDCGFDVNATCGNPCFEYEIQISTGNQDVNVVNIDGCSGTADCDALHGNGGTAYVCNPCNQDAIEVMAGSSECSDATNIPVFWMAYVSFSQLPGLNSTDEFRLVPVTPSSPNQIIYQNTPVDDFGGVGDPNDPSDCDCATQCAGQGCADCMEDCALACAATRNRSAGTFPVEWLELSGQFTEQGVLINWSTGQELNNSHFEVERLFEDGHVDNLGSLPGQGNTQQIQRYSFTAPLPNTPIAIYRIKQVNYDGGFTYSSLLEVNRTGDQAFHVEVISASADAAPQIRFHAAGPRVVQWQISSLNGQQIASSQTNLKAGDQNVTFTEVRLAAGLYLLKAIDPRSGEQQSLKFQVQ
jgi:hypothetical protein